MENETQRKSKRGRYARPATRIANAVASALLVFNLFPAQGLAEAREELADLMSQASAQELVVQPTMQVDAPAEVAESEDQATEDPATEGPAKEDPQSATEAKDTAAKDTATEEPQNDAEPSPSSVDPLAAAGTVSADVEVPASSNLRDFVTAVSVEGAYADEAGQVVVEEDKVYTVVLSFAQRPDLQFANDDSMSLELPAGFVPVAEQPSKQSMPDEPTYFDVYFTDDAGERQQVKIDKDSWWIDGTTLHFAWLVRDADLRSAEDVAQAQEFLNGLTNAEFNIPVAGTFAVGTASVDFGAPEGALSMRVTPAQSEQEQGQSVADEAPASSVKNEPANAKPATSAEQETNEPADKSTPPLLVALRAISLAKPAFPRRRAATAKDTNLTSFLRSADINAPTNDEGAYVLMAGSSYTFRFGFGENDDVQFDSNGSLSYKMPSGLSFSEASSSGTFDIVINDGRASYTISGNTYKIEDGVVKVQINESDPNIAHYNASANVRFNLAFEGTVDENATRIDFGNGITKDVEIDKSSSVKATKYATVDLANHKVHYTLSVSSTGNSKNVKVTDAISSPNDVLSLDAATIHATSSTGQSVSMTGGATGNSFSYTIPSMSNGEVVTLSYDANIDTGKIPITDSVIQVVEGTNKATATNDYDPTPSTVEVKTNIDYQPTVQKDAMTVEDDGKTLDCSFTFNGSALTSGAGYKLTDTLGQYLALAGDGITVQVYDASGASVESRYVAWGVNGLAGTKEGTSFTYTIPETDSGHNYKYVVTYKAQVNLPAGTNTQQSVTNTVKVEGTNKTSTNTGVVTPVGGALGVFKTADSVDYTNKVVNWTITINVPEGGLDASYATLYDTPPTLGGYAEAIVLNDGKPDIIVAGLQGTEAYDASMEGNKLKVTFYQDANKTKPGLGSGNARTVTVKVKTTINDDWVKAGATNSWYWDHTNNVELGTNTGIRGSANVQLTGEGVTKTSEPAGYRTTASGVQLPVYKYTLLLNNVTSADNLIADTFDRSILAPFYTVDAYGNNTVVDGFNPDWFSWHTTNATNNGRSQAPVTYADTATGMNIITNADSMLTNSETTTGYWPITKIVYYLTVKDEAALLRLRGLAAAASGGTYQLQNTASWNGDSTSTVDYQYPALTKEILTPDSELTKTDQDIWANFRIAYNPDAAQLNHGAATTLTDHVNGLSVDITSIKVSPENTGITYDMTGDDLTFQNVPDSTSVTIAYRARVIYQSIGNIGDTINVNFSNTATTQNGYSSTVSKTAHRHNSGAGQGSVYSINLMKYAAGDMDTKLEGAVFELYHAKPDANATIGYVLDEATPVVDKTGKTASFTTNSAGTITVVGRQDQDGWHLNANTYYFLREVTAPEGYMLATNDYAFRISEDGTTDYSRYVYHDSDTMSAKDYPGTDLFVHKIWSDDPQGQNGTHDDHSVTVQLQQKRADQSAWSNDIRHQTTSGWQDSPMTVTLNSAGDWRDVFRGLPLNVPKDLSNPDGEDVAVTYQIKEVAINGTPADTSTADAAPGANSDFAWSYGTEEETSGTTTRTVHTITNTPQGGSLKLKKLVTVDGDSTQGTLADGTYSFTITGPSGSATAITKNVAITIENGTIASASGDVVQANDAAVITDGFVEVTDLSAGDYTIHETAPTNGTALVGANDQIVTVVAGQRGASVAEAGKATFTNSLATGGLKVTKSITRNGSSELTDVVKGRMAGSYTFTLYKDAECTQPVTQPVSDGSGEERVVTLTATMGADGQPATSSEVTGLAPGDYWVKEVENAPDDFPWGPIENPVKVTVEAGKTGEQAATASFTNDVQVGSIRLRKLVTVNGQPVSDFQSYVQQTEKDGEMRYPTDGEYRFQIRKDDPSTANDPLVAVRVWIQDGVMANHAAGEGQLAYPKFYTKKPIAGITPSGAGWYIAPLTIKDGWVQVDDLVPGTYYVKERTSEMPEGMKLGAITLNGATQAKNEVEVQVTANNVDAVPAVSFTNNYTETADLHISKDLASTASTSQYANKEFTFTVTLQGERGQAVNGTYGDLEFTNGVSTFTLKDDETKTALGLPTGIGYEITEATDPDFTLAGITVNDEEQSVGSGKGTGTISTAHDPGTVRFTNTLKEGGFTVAKQVNSTYEPDKASGRTFHFVVTLTNSTLTGTFGSMTFERGRAEFDLAHGQSVSASGLPVGTTYSVVESTEDGFTTTWSGSTTGTVQDGANPTITATNQRIYGGIQLNKTVVSQDAGDTTPFEFTVTLDDTGLSGTYGDLNFENGVAHVKLQNGQTKSTEQTLPVGLGYTVTEKDNSDYTLTGHAGDSGTIGTGITPVSFTNTKDQGGLSLYKSVSSPLASDAQREFTFTIAEVVAQGHTATSKGKTFTDGLGHTITFNDAGVAEGVKLKHNQTISLTGLEVGSTYRITEVLSAEDAKLFNTAASTGTSARPQASVTIVSDAVSESETSQVRFANTRATGDLHVKKVVESDASADANQPFTFTVTLSDTTISGVYGNLEFKDGVATVALSHNQTATATGLPVGITYTVRETQATGFHCTDVSVDETSQGTTEATGAIAAQGSNAVFTNARDTGNLELSKQVVSAAAADANAEFTFTVRLSDTSITKTYGAMSFTNGEATVRLKKGESARATGLPQGIGYTITEASATGFQLTEIATNGVAAAAGATQATGTIGQQEAAVTFTNTRTLGGLKVAKTVVSDAAADKDQSFTFTVRLDDTGIGGTFGGVSFAEGVGSFTLKGGEQKEISGLPTGVGYTVTEQDASGFVRTGSAERHGTVQANPSVIAYTNTRSTGDLKVAKKVVSAATADANVAFDFTVKLYKSQDTTDANLDTTINKTYGDMTFAGGVATFHLTKDEEALATGLPQGLYYVVSETTGTGFTQQGATGATGTVGSTLSSAEFTNERELGGLVIQKHVESPFEADKTKDYTFTVTLNGAPVTGTYGDLVFANGVATTTLKNGETKTATGLPVGVTYTVVESGEFGFTTYGNTETGRTPLEQDASGNPLQQGAIANTPQTKAFYNVRDTGDLSVQKNVTSIYTPDNTRQFDFRVELTGAPVALGSAYEGTVTRTSSVPESVSFNNGVATFKLAAGDVFRANGLPAGTSYTVTETATNGFVPWSGASGTVERGATANVTATNARSYGHLDVSKSVVSHQAGDATRNYSFIVTFYADEHKNQQATSLSGSYAIGASEANFAGGQATFTLTDGQTASFADLPLGLYYTVSEESAEGMRTTSVGSEGSVGSSTPVRFTNMRSEGGLFVSKRVASPLSADSQRDFSFTVTLYNDAACQQVATQVNGTYAADGATDQAGAMSFRAGVATFSLKDGQTAYALNLPVGLYYKVQEDEDQDFVTSVKAHGQESAAAGNTATGKITQGTNVSDTFVNTRTRGNLEVTKKLLDVNGTQAQDSSQEFAMRVELYDHSISGTFGQMTFVNGVAEFTLRANQTVSTANAAASSENDAYYTLPAGMRYRVTETHANGYSTSWTNTTKGTTYSYDVSQDWTRAADGTYAPSKESKTIAWTDAAGTRHTSTFSHDLDYVANGSGARLDSWAGSDSSTEWGWVDDARAAGSSEVHTTNISAKATDNVTFTNRPEVAPLTLYKQVESQLAADAQQTFHFRVALEDTSVTGTYGDLSFQSGVAELDLRDGESKTALNLPKGVRYNVFETDVAGFNQTAENASGTLGYAANGKELAEVRYLPAGSKPDVRSRAGYTNSRLPGKLLVRKVVRSSAPSRQKFHFDVTLFRDAARSTKAEEVNGAYPLILSPGGEKTIAFNKGVASFDLANGEQVQIANLPSGLYYQVDEAADAGFSTSWIAQTGTIGSEGNDASEPGALVTATNTRKEGSLIVSKKLVSDRATDAETQFLFVVDLYSDSARKVPAGIVGTYGDMTFAIDKNGNDRARVVLKGGQSATATGLPEGVYYKVQETKIVTVNSDGDTKDVDITGFTTTYNGTRQGVISAAEASSVEGVNTRATGTLAVQKVVHSDRATDQTDVPFTLVVTLSDRSISGVYGDMTFENGVARVQVLGSQTKTATGLPTDVAYTVTEDSAVGFWREGWTVAEGDGAQCPGNSGTIKVKTNAKGQVQSPVTPIVQKVTITNARYTGGLTVTKQVVSPSAADKDPNRKFLFTVTLSDTSIDGSASSGGRPYGATFNAGVATFELAHGESKEIGNLPVDVTYTVAEASDGDFALSGTTGRTGTIARSGSASTFTNTRKTGGLAVEKELTNALAGDEAQEFVFVVKLGDNSIDGTFGDMAFVNGIARVALKPGERKVATGIPAGVTYAVTEELTDAQKHAYALVGSDGAEGTIGEDGRVAHFTNARKPATAQLRVSKSFNDWQADDSFEFTLKAGTNTAGVETPMPQPGQEVATATKDAVDATFGSISFQKEGVYTYSIAETPGTDSRVVYDTAAREARVTVERNASTDVLTASVEYAQQDGTFGPALVVSNRRRVAKVGLQVTKSVREWGAGDSFEFVLQAEANTAEGNVQTPMPAAANGKASMRAVATKDAPTAVFGEVAFRAVGEYRYTIREVQGDGPYVYDKTVHDVLVRVVRDDTIDDLVATATYDDGASGLTIANRNAPLFQKQIQDANDSTGEASDWQDSADYDMGDAVPYRLVATLPADIGTYKRYHLTFTDRMEAGLTFNRVQKVTVAGAEVGADDYDLSKVSDHEFTLRLDWGDGQDFISGADLAGAKVEVYFTATLNKDAKLGREGNVNACKLAYSSNPASADDGPADEGELPWDYVIAYTYKLDVSKVDPDGKALAGAEFKLEKVLANKSTVPVALEVANNVFSAVGLDDGTYVLTETKAPAGFKAVEPVTFVVVAKHGAAWNYASSAAADPAFAPASRTGVLASLTGSEETGVLKLTADDELAGLSGDVVNVQNSGAPEAQKAATDLRVASKPTPTTGDATNALAVAALAVAGGLALVAGALHRRRNCGCSGPMSN